MSSPDIKIAGAGVIGLSLALELHNRGARVIILERDTALQHASTAAAGMLAVHDPHNPPQLLPLSTLSAEQYPAWLAHIESLSHHTVPIQTQMTQQRLADNVTVTLDEVSIDPRQLAQSLLAAVRSTSIDLREHTSLVPSHVSAEKTVWTTGAWGPLPIVPRKGQMLRVRLPSHLDLREVHRSEDIYIVPRTQGPQAGSALIGATIEHAGFDITINPGALSQLRVLASHLIPELASEREAPQLESWAGLRPGTPDDLPLLGPHPTLSNHFLATGHFRNGILLAPVTAVLMADLIENKAPLLSLAPFAPNRFAHHHRIPPILK